MSTIESMVPPDLAQSFRDDGLWTSTPLLERYSAHVTERPDGLAVVDDRGTEYSHSELWAASEQVVERLEWLGVQPGQAALIALPNQAEWMVMFLGLLRAGLVPVTVPVTTDPETLRFILDVAQARVAFVPRGWRGRDTAAALGASISSSPWACGGFVVEEDGALADGPLPNGRVPNEHDPELAHLFFTSSTTGRPKPVMHTEATLAALNLGFTSRFALGQDTPIFMPSPLGHSVGAMHGARLSMFHGAPLVLQGEWDPDRALALVDQHGCRFTAAATPFLKDLVEAPAPAGGIKFATLEAFLCGGAQVPPALLERCREELPKTFVTVLWGMTEGGVTTCVPGDDFDRIRETAGTGLPGLELVILDPDGQRRPVGEEGELAMRGPGVFVGYLDRPDLNEELFTEQGFFRTGDQAVLDGDGYVRITGRIKDLIIRGAVNISPVPTENVIFKHPDVLAVAVMGAPDDRLGERICAVVQAKRQLDLDEVTQWCEREGLPKRQWPERLILVDSVPRTAAGKIRKHELRDQVHPQLVEVSS